MDGAVAMLFHSMNVLKVELPTSFFARYFVVKFLYLTLILAHPPFNNIQVLSKRTALAREIVREVVGLSPYERRILDMIKTGGSSADKRIYKYAKKRLGSHKRAVQKREDIKQVNSKQRARAAMGS